MTFDQEESLPQWMKNQLPKYRNVKSIPKAFSDSTHQLWRLELERECSEQESSDFDCKNHILKLCSNTSSPFWWIMSDLYNYDLRAEIANFSECYSLIEKLTSLEIPKLIQAETLDKGNAYILTSELQGSAVTPDDVNNVVYKNDHMVKQLTLHLAELHSIQKDTWGSLNKPIFDSADWNDRLKTTLIKSTKKWGGVFLHSDTCLKQSIDACESIKVDTFVPIMTDLRWDQFLHKEGELSSLVDLDAFVFAPVELDFVILEYLLTPEQLEVFNEVYTQFHMIPTIEPVRSTYRLLLFYMQILGETDLDKWMNQEAWF